MGRSNINELKAQAKSLFDNKNLTEAKKLYQEICRHKPDLDSIYMLGMTYGMTSDFSKAEQLLKKSLKLAPDNDIILNNLAIVQLKQNKHKEAIKNLKKSLSLNPTNTNTLNTLGNLYRELGKSQIAEEYYRKSLAINPKDAASNNNLGTSYLDRCKYDEAIKQFKNALIVNPKYYDAHYNLGAAYQSIGEHKKAIEHYSNAKRINPSSSHAQSAIANSLEKQGLNCEALTALQDYSNKYTDTADIIHMYGRVYLNLGEYKEGIDKVEMYLTTHKPNQIDEQELRFCLGDLYNKKKSYDKAFEQYKIANTLRAYDYNNKATEKYFSSIIENYNIEKLPSLSYSKIKSDTPIFILGMPRSGTSLIEQILASLDEVYGGGELSYIGDTINEASFELKESGIFPNKMDQLGSELINRLSDNYLSLIQKASDNSHYVTDKMPHNFMYIGYIYQLFPNCKIIHCHRDPVDVCLSIYFHNFNSNHPYSDNLKNLAHYYGQYHKLMQHWKNTYPDRIIDVDYENLINAPEETISDILDYIGLKWSDKCLRFHESKRNVNTPSYSQVRKPLYKSSLKRWKNYTNQIQELKKDLACYH